MSDGRGKRRSCINDGIVRAHIPFTWKYKQCPGKARPNKKLNGACPRTRTPFGQQIIKRQQWCTELSTSLWRVVRYTNLMAQHSRNQPIDSLDGRPNRMFENLHHKHTPRLTKANAPAPTVGGGGSRQFRICFTAGANNGSLCSEPHEGSSNDPGACTARPA